MTGVVPQDGPDSPRPFSPLSASLISTNSALGQQRLANGQRFSTLCATVDNPDSNHKDRYGSSSVPIYQTATFKGMGGQYDYSRSGNPSRTFLEHHIAKISSAKHAFAVTSGMGALDIICRVLQPGDEIIAGNDLYGGSNRLLAYLRQHNGIITHHVDTTRLESITPLLVRERHQIRMVLLESPTNPLLQIVDLRKITTQVKEVFPEALVVVDNTMMSPYLMRPLEFGVDIVYDSGTKYLSGHHDLMAGLVTCNSDEIAQQLGFIINSIGNGLAPFECFLLLRGVKTLAIRLDRQQASAISVAKYLDQLGFKVNYPGLKNHRNKDVHDRLANGPGAVLSFETGDKELSEKIVGSTRLWGISVSFGCVNSLISMPCLMSHASIDPAVRAARNLPEDLIRLCVGIEDSDDLLEDLESALIEAGAIRIMDETAVGGGFERVKIGDRSRSGSETDMLVSKTKTPSSVLVSAPGKVILFGEHAVVFGKKALAASVDLRCFCLVEPDQPSAAPALVQVKNQVTLRLPDSGFSVSWFLEDLPWDSLPDLDKIQGLDELSVNSELSRLLYSLVCEKSEKTSLIQACHAFLYLFMNLARNEQRRTQVYTIRSTLPIGAGLGSSASYSVCLVTGLLYTHSHLIMPTNQKINEESIQTINRWAFLGEKILHGNPSGVDNTVSSYGGAISFRRKTDEKDSGMMEILGGFESMKIMIADTKISRDTKAILNGVAQRKKEEPDYFYKIMNEIGRITEEAKGVMKQADPNQDKVKLGELMDSNHSQLSALGVSHEKLETVKTIGHKYGVKSKLTGAGGGGCMISLIPDGFDKKLNEKLKEEIEANGMKTYECGVGGKGVGIKNLDEGTQTIEKEGFIKWQLSELNSQIESTRVGWVFGG